jgi:hypothetical protein
LIINFVLIEHTGPLFLNASDIMLGGVKTRSMS